MTTRAPSYSLRVRPLRHVRRCIVCEQEFQAHKATANYCSLVCRKRWSRLSAEEKAEVIANRDIAEEVAS